MKITEYIYDHTKNPWLGGGGAFITQNVCKYLTQKGHDVTVVHGRYPDSKKTETINKVKYIGLGSGISYLLSRLTYTLQANIRLLYDNSDLIILNNTPFSPFIPLNNKNTITSIHNYFGSTNIKNYKLIGSLLFLIEKQYIKRSRHIITVSKTLAQKIKSVNPDCIIKVCYNGIPDFMYLNKKKEDYAIFAGRIDNIQKNLLFLIDVWKSINKNNNKFKLMIVGSGKDERLIQTYIKENKIENIMIKQRVDQKALSELYGKARLFLMPSEFESFGMTLIEAQAAGTAAITSDLPVFKEICISNSAVHLPLEKKIWEECFPWYG